jgi:hypothetical protein
MNNTVNLNYIRELYSCLLEKTDEELDEFDINDPNDRGWLIEEAYKSFLKFGPKSKQSVISAIGFIIKSGCNLDYWRFAVPHDLPLATISDKESYMHQLYEKLTKEYFGEIKINDGISLIDEIGPLGLNTKE